MNIALPAALRFLAQHWGGVAALKKTIAAVAAFTLLVPVANAQSRDLVQIAYAGQLFGAICQEAYPDSAHAESTAKANGFNLDVSSGLYEHRSLDMQMRINSEKCAIRFLTRKRAQPPGAEFAENSASMITSADGHGDVDIKYEPVGSSRRRVAATRLNNK